MAAAPDTIRNELDLFRKSFYFDGKLEGLEISTATVLALDAEFRYVTLGRGEDARVEVIPELPALEGTGKKSVDSRQSVEGGKEEAGEIALIKLVGVREDDSIEIKLLLNTTTNLSPDTRTVCFRERTSGLSEQRCAEGRPLDETLRRVQEILRAHSPCILLGHGLHNDARVMGLQLEHGVYPMDSSWLYFQQPSYGFRRDAVPGTKPTSTIVNPLSLRALSAKLQNATRLKEDGVHSALEDATATLELYVKGGRARAEKLWEEGNLKRVGSRNAIFDAASRLLQPEDWKESTVPVAPAIATTARPEPKVLADASTQTTPNVLADASVQTGVEVCI